MVTDNALIMVILSFFASVGFGIGFRIWGKHLILAGVGGALTRIILILLSHSMEERFLYMTLSALAASFYGEILAVKFRIPSTYYIYPAIVPLIPGDLFFYAIQGIIAQNWTTAWTNGWECLKALLGMSLGFVISSSVMHYIRKRNLDQLALRLLRPAAIADQKRKGRLHTIDETDGKNTSSNG